jgi:hypothetical protein
MDGLKMPSISTVIGMLSAREREALRRKLHLAADAARNRGEDEEIQIAVETGTLLADKLRQADNN